MATSALSPRRLGVGSGMYLRDVPDDVYAAPVAAAEDSRQSLSAFVVDRLCEVAQAARVADYVSTYPAPPGTGVTTEDAVAAMREVREASSRHHRLRRRLRRLGRTA